MARKAVFARRVDAQQQTLAAATQVIDILTELETNIGRTLVDVTVGRIRLTLPARSNSATGELDIRVGVIPATAEAIAAGTASLPSPGLKADFNNDWMLWDQLIYDREGSLATPAVEGNVVHTLQVVTRGMRKLRGTTRLAFILFNNAATAVDWHFQIEVVVLL